jgi:hypothetical protein
MGFPGCQRVRAVITVQRPPPPAHSAALALLAAQPLTWCALMYALCWVQGTCVFIEDEATAKQKAKCRHDFYQVGSTISMSVYAKKTDPSQCFFKASSHNLSLEIGYDAGLKTYSLDVKLFGPIDPTKCACDWIIDRSPPMHDTPASTQTQRTGCESLTVLFCSVLFCECVRARVCGCCDAEQPRSRS